MSKNHIRSIKGTQDILPEESHKWRILEKKIHDTMELFNYGQIRTPAFEKTELFDRGVGLDRVAVAALVSMQGANQA